jgi:O-antigen ligase
MLKINYREKLIILVLNLFIIIRPIASLSYPDSHGVAGRTYNEIMTIGITYLLLCVALLNIARIRIKIIDFLLAQLCLYSLISILWGSNPREVVRFLLPVILFYVARLSFISNDRINNTLLIFIGAFIVPVVGSFYMITTGISGNSIIYWTKLVRYEGLYLGPHELAHHTFCFLSILAIYLTHTNNLADKPKLRILLYGIGTLAILNLYRSYVRTSYVGLAILILFLLLGWKRYKLLIFFTIISIIVVAYSTSFQVIFFDFIDPLKGEDKIGMGIEGMGSGRIWIWKNKLIEFGRLPFERIFLGKGIGNETLYGKTFFGASHNDFLSLLMCGGLIGVFLYFAVILTYFFDIVTSSCNRKIKYTFLGLLIAILLMNFSSNSYVTRSSLGQYNYFYMGLFYSIKRLAENRKEKEIVA